MLHALIETRLKAAVRAVLPEAPLAAIQVRPTTDTRFGDYQSNALMALAKEAHRNPRQLAADVVARLDVHELCAGVEIAGPGFLNFRLHPLALATCLLDAARGQHLFFAPTSEPRTIVIDFSSPNVAKPMHVGHIRSTVLGDALGRIFRLLGHHVITDNHIGDWGTQFGMLLVGWKSMLNRDALIRDGIAELERIYQAINQQCDANPTVRETARAELVKLQAGDPENQAIWREMIEISQHQFDAIYGRLGVRFDHTLGESFYNPQLKAVVDELIRRGIAQESDGAIVIFSDHTLPPKDDPFLIQRDGEWQPNPVLIQKRDGAANYATTDLATLQYRTTTWSPHEIVYVTDGRQQLHFRQVFAAFRRWHPERADAVKLVHVWFGSILGDDGRPFKTRSGDTVKLTDLLDEAEERVFAVVSEKNPELPEPERREIARVVGVGAVKYADLLPNRQSDYLFSWDKLLSLHGNTAPYLQYAYTRVRSIFRKSDLSTIPNAADQLVLAAPEELALARHLLHFGLTLEGAAAEYRPNFLCNYLFELAGLFARFYEACPVLKADESVRASRLILCDLTSRVLKQGLLVLGIETTEVM